MNLKDIASTNLVAALGLSDLPEEGKNAFLKQAADEILVRIAARIEENLPEDKKPEFHKLFAEPHKDEERITFISREISDFETIVLKEALLFKAEALGRAQQPKEQ